MDMVSRRAPCTGDPCSKGCAGPGSPSAIPSCRGHITLPPGSPRSLSLPTAQPRSPSHCPAPGTRGSAQGLVGRTVPAALAQLPSVHSAGCVQAPSPQALKPVDGVGSQVTHLGQWRHPVSQPRAPQAGRLQRPLTSPLPDPTGAPLQSGQLRPVVCVCGGVRMVLAGAQASCWGVPLGQLPSPTWCPRRGEALPARAPCPLCALRPCPSAASRPCSLPQKVAEASEPVL